MVLVTLLLAVPALIVFLRCIRRISRNGPQVRHDLFALPEVLAGTVVLFGFVFLIAQAHFSFLPSGSPEPFVKGHEILHAETATPPGIKELLITGMIVNALLPGVVIGIVLIRGARPGDLFGFGKVGFGKTLGLGLGLGLLAASLVSVVSVIAQQFMKEEAPQFLIQRFQSAANGSDTELMLLIGFSAVVVAPIVEELLFRGIFYPVLARGLGRIPSAVACSVLFAFAHDTYAAVPSLTVLALIFTLVYEMTGSLLVPMVMHMTFNGISLGVLWWITNAGIR